MSRARLLLLCSLLSAFSGALAESVPRDAGNVPVQLAGDTDPSQTKVYIVQLKAPSVAETRAPGIKVNKESPDVRAYAAQIGEDQDRVLQKAVRTVM